MNPLDFQLQLVFAIAVIIPFLIKRDTYGYLPGVINPLQGVPSLWRALMLFTAADIVQLSVVWIGNMSDAPYVWYFSHLVAGIIFGAGLRLAMLSWLRESR